MSSIEKLKVAVDEGDKGKIVSLLHEIVPTFKDPIQVNSEAVARGEF